MLGILIIINQNELSCFLRDLDVRYLSATTKPGMAFPSYLTYVQVQTDRRGMKE
jgi:hypothetical protein